ncbi:hypothetical protein [uncultured Jatrophihabitans sp.]|uniref:hypothetical protein n=1 Tax=uncultured Jatrophihabitans sp. TaxID=1610747 RepID=UPI0035CAF8FB
MASGSTSYHRAGGGRARVGYDGGGTVVSDAGGARPVYLQAGASGSARRGVGVDSAGNPALASGATLASGVGAGG